MRFNARKLLVVAAAVLVLAGVGPARAADPAPADVAPRLENGDMVMGAANAPVTIIEYASLTCPHCANFQVATFPQLKTNYIDKGLVKFVYRDFPLDQIALKAAMVVRCAGPQRYFGFLHVFFEQQGSWAAGNDGDKMMASLKRLAKLGGMSESEFDACLANKQVQDSVLGMRMAGEQQFQVRSTPTLIINGERQSGALSFEELDKKLKPLAKPS